MTRRLLPLLALLAVGCDVGDKGAVTVRWRLVDKATGVNYDPRDRAQGTACACVAGDTAGGCAASYGWIVHDVRIVVADPATGAAIGGVPESDLIFNCRDREATTRFDLPVGGPWAFSLRAFDAAAGVAADEGTTPPPTLRQVRKAEIVNLDVIEIAVHPLPLGGPDGGAADLAPPGSDAASPP